MEKDERSLTLSDIVRVIKSNVILIIIITAIVSLIGTAYTLFYAKPTYKATSSMTVQVPSEKDGVEDLPNSLKYVNTVADLIVDYGTLKHVVAEYNQNETGKAGYEKISVSALKSEIKTSANTNSLYVTFSITDTNKTRIVVLSNYIMNYIKSMENDNNPETTDDLLASITVKSVPESVEDVAYNSPNKLLYVIISFCAGVVLAVIIVFIKEFMSSKFKTKEDVEDLGYDIAGILFDNKPKKDANEVCLIEPCLSNFEPYNKILSVIKYSNLDKDMKVIMVTSSGMDELKSTTTCNLAYSAVNNGKKALIIDLDLRKPSIHKAFNQSRENGLTEIIGSEIEVEKAIKRTESGIDVITAGKAVVNPVSLLGTNKISALIKDLNAKYDYIFLDTAPLLICNDSLLVVKDVDGILFNVSINQLKKKHVSDCLKTLKNVEANIIGLNVVKYKPSNSESYSYYHYKNYYNAKN